jgi:hypothetical protein
VPFGTAGKLVKTADTTRKLNGHGPDEASSTSLRIPAVRWITQSTVSLVKENNFSTNERKKRK